jgi:hypothetical protein
VANSGRRNFCASGGGKTHVVFHHLGKCINLLIFHRATLAGRAHTKDDFGSIERLAIT